jgi:LPXTG-motif cell wall-anchored protein
MAHDWRRLASLVLAVGLAAIAQPVVTPAVAAPVRAVAPEPALAIYLPDLTVAAESPGKVNGALLFSPEGKLLVGVTLVYDFSDLAGLAEVTTDTINCETAGHVITCTDPVETFPGPWGATLFEVTVKPLPGVAAGASGTLRATAGASGTLRATAGASGTLRATAGAEGVAEVTDDARVRVGDGVDLAAEQELSFSSRPGGSFGVEWAITNAGQRQVDSVTMFVDAGLVVDATTLYSNCTYVGTELRTCSFDTPLAPGKTYVIDDPMPFALGNDAHAPGDEAIGVSWMTPAEFADLKGLLDRLGIPTGTAGPAEKLTLVEALPAMQARGAQADTEPLNNWAVATIRVDGDNKADFAAIGAVLRGPAGTTVTPALGAKNNGPATLDLRIGSGESVIHATITVPPGTTAVRVPRECAPAANGVVDWENAGKPGAGVYLCTLGDLVHPAGEMFTSDLELRIDSVIDNARGSVVLYDRQFEVPTYPLDPNKSNDKADIVVNPTAGGGGSLPITGAPTWSIAVAGAVLLLLGAAGLLLARRRRMRFITAD